MSVSVSRAERQMTHEVRKWANDWRVSVWRMRMGEIS